LLEAQTLQQNRAIDSIGLGDSQRDRNAGRQQIEDRYSQQRQQLEQARITGQIEQQQYAEQLERIRRFQDEALSSYEAYYERLRQADGDYRNGVNEALANYVAESANTARQVEDLFSNAFKGMENALVDFVTTGKLDFSSLADSIVADVTRIIIQQQLIKPLASFIGGNATGEGVFANILGSLFGGGRATGGPVQSGSLYEINETGKGPGEILNVAGRQYLLPSQNGSVQTNQAGVGGGMSVVNNFVISQPTDKRTQQQVAAAAGQGVQRALSRNN
jgi:lambda family phage tail tape measure protein